MIDPNIILQSQTPNQLEGQALSLQQMRQGLAQGQQNMALTDQRIQSEQFANQQAGRAQAAQAALNQALQANTTKDPVTGAPIVDYDKVTTAMSDAGFGQEAMQFKSSVNALKDSDLRLSQLSDQVKNDQASHAAQLLGTVLDAPLAARPVVYQRALQQATEMGYLKPGTMPAQYTPALDPVLAARREQALSVVQQYGTKYNEARVQAAEDRATASFQQAQAAEQRARNAEATRRYQFTNSFDKSGHPIVVDTHTGQLTVSPDIQVDLQDTPGAKGRQLTPDASLANQRANNTDFEKNSAAELTYRQQRDALDSAIKNGQTYVDKNGRTVLFSTMKNAQGDPLSPTDIQGLRADMAQRRAVAESGVEQAVSSKNNAMQRNGVKPQVSTQQAIAGYRGQQNQGLPTDPTGKSKYKAGDTAYNVRTGQPVKVLGFTPEGKVITGK